MPSEAQYIASNVAGTATALSDGSMATPLIDNQRRQVVVVASNQSAMPVKGTITATAHLTSSATLPAAGAFEADPATNAMVAVPATARRATIYISYIRGASGGQSAHKIFVSDGSKVAQVLAPDGTYSAISGRASTSSSAIGYAIDVELEGGETLIGIASAETGVTGTPGSYSSEITFG